jgi:hypothetical protein
MTPPAGEGVPGFVEGEREITGSFRVGSDANNPWRTIAFILGLIISGGVVFSALGKAFYVTRSEYTEKVLSDSVERTSVQKTLESVNKALAGLEISIKDLSASVAELKGDVRRRSDR